jgi:hypothetical protein
MIELTLKDIKPDNFIIRGNKIQTVVDKFIFHSPSTIVKIIKLNDALDDAIDLIKDLPSKSLIYAIGNQVGAGQEILEKISKLKYHD